MAQAYQFKIQQKQNFIDEMAAMIEKLNGKVPKGTSIDETADDLIWDDELEVRQIPRSLSPPLPFPPPLPLSPP